MSTNVLSRTGFTLIAASLALTPLAAAAKGGVPGDDEGAVARIAPVATVKLAAPAAAAAGSRSGEQIYAAICGACHEAGVAGAPKTGDKAAWAPRIKLGLDGLLKSAIAGKNAMPPRGGSDATDDELKDTIKFIANKSGAKF